MDEDDTMQAWAHQLELEAQERTCQFCGKHVDPNEPHAWINHQLAHTECMDREDFRSAARAHAQLNQIQREMAEAFERFNKVMADHMRRL